MIWLAFALVALAAVLLIVTVRAPKGETADALAHYRAQLDELAEDEKRGAIDTAGAAAARLEIERRILKAADGKPEMPTVDGSHRLPILLAALALLGAAGFYAPIGRPDLPASPAKVAEARHRPVQEGGPSYGDAIATVEAHLKAEPDDRKGWEVLAKAARAVGDHAGAAGAFARLAELEPGVTRWRVQEFESYLMLGGGQIGPAARLLLARILKDAPDHPAGQYYLGLAYLQSGNADGARAVWTALADRSAPDAPWMGPLRAQLAQLGVKPPALDDEQMAMVEGMSGEEREAFIRAMMARLAARLEANPNDADGWLMLARSQLAMGDRDAAIAALRQGLDAVSADRKAALKAFLDNIVTNADP